VHALLAYVSFFKGVGIVATFLFYRHFNFNFFDSYSDAAICGMIVEVAVQDAS